MDILSLIHVVLSLGIVHRFNHLATLLTGVAFPVRTSSLFLAVMSFWFLLHTSTLIFNSNVFRAIDLARHFPVRMRTYSVPRQPEYLYSAVKLSKNLFPRYLLRTRSTAIAKSVKGTASIFLPDPHWYFHTLYLCGLPTASVLPSPSSSLSEL